MRDLVVFVGVTLILAYVSRGSLPRPGSHGFYRFFAWESMLGLYVLDMPAWDADTHPVCQTIAGASFSIALLLALGGFAQLLLSGAPDPGRNDAPMLPFEKTTTLVTTGIYRYIRHPIYSSLLFLCWGFFFKQPAAVNGVLAVTASALLIVTARVEENENIRYFGEAYRDYMKRTRMFLPFLL